MELKISIHEKDPTSNFQVENKAEFKEINETTLPDESTLVRKVTAEKQMDDLEETRMPSSRCEHERDHESETSESPSSLKIFQENLVPANLSSDRMTTLTIRKSHSRSHQAANSRAKPPVKEDEVHSVINDVCIAADMTAGKLKESKDECEKLQAQVLKLQQDLKEAHDFIFSLQLPQASITESEAGIAFRSLCDGIQEWVERELGDFIYDKVLLTNRPMVSYVRDLLEYIPPSGREACRIRGTDEYNITAAIIQFLIKNVFDRDFYCGVGEGEFDFLQSIQASMRSLEPPRDPSAIRFWRSEMYTAIANRPGFNNQRQRRSIYLSKQLEALLSIFMPRADGVSQKLVHSIQKCVVEPAFSLAHKLQLAVNKFSVEWSVFGRMHAKDRSREFKDYSSVECVDLLREGKIIKPQRAAHVGDITFVLDLTPALVIEIAKGESYLEPKIVSKGKIVVVAMKRQEGRYVPPETMDGEAPTLVYWMSKKVGLEL